VENEWRMSNGNEKGWNLSERNILSLEIKIKIPRNSKLPNQE